VTESIAHKAALGGSRWMARALGWAERELSRLQPGLSVTRQLHIGDRLLGSVRSGAPSANVPYYGASSRALSLARVERFDGAVSSHTLVPRRTTRFDAAKASASYNLGKNSNFVTRGLSNTAERKVMATAAPASPANKPSLPIHAADRASGPMVPEILSRAPDKFDVLAPRRVILTMGRQTEATATVSPSAAHGALKGARRSDSDSNRLSWQERPSPDLAAVAVTARAAAQGIGRPKTGDPLSSTKAVAPSSAASANRSIAPVGAGRPEASQMVPAITAVQMPLGRAPAVTGDSAPISGPTMQTQPVTGDSSAPTPTVGPTEGDVYLDGTLMGRWVSRALAHAASRQPSGGTAFDSTRSRLPAGAMIGV
jgi:hypothetical protein